MFDEATCPSSSWVAEGATRAVTDLSEHMDRACSEGNASTDDS